MQKGLIKKMSGIDELDARLRKVYQEDFNIISWCGIGTTEVKHSAMIADLLNPKGCHGCGDFPLKLFLDKADIRNIQDLSSTIVTTEETVMNGERRVDIFLKNKAFSVIIENKTESSDHHDQLKDYGTVLQDRNGQRRLVYLTFNGDQPNQTPDVDFFLCLSYRNDIIDWLDQIGKECIPEETKLAVIHYRNFLKKLLNKESGEVRKKIKEWVRDNIVEAKSVLKNTSLLPDTRQYIYESLCYAYCKNLLQDRIRAEKYEIVIADCSYDKISSAPFFCVCKLPDGTRLEFQPLAHNRHSYGKLYGINEDGTLCFGSLSDRQWDCNFFEWLNESTKDTIEEKQPSESGISIASCFSKCTPP